MDSYFEEWDFCCLESNIILLYRFDKEERSYPLILNRESINEYSFSHSDSHQIDFIIIISIEVDCYGVVFENLSVQWIRIVDWKLERVLINEVNMITYEWNRDDLKEKESEIE